MRWLSLIAVLAGCTLITDPDSFEGEPVDAGTDDARVRDTSVDTTTDTPMPDATACTDDEVDLEGLRVCVDGTFRPCDMDRDGFIPLGMPECEALDAMRDFPPPDCDDMNVERRHGLAMCGGGGEALATCVANIGDAFGGTQPGEIAFRLDALTRTPAPTQARIAFIDRGPGAYDAYYLASCSPGCEELHKITFTYESPWNLEASDQSIRPANQPMMGRFLNVDAHRDGESVVLGVIKADMGDDWVGVYQNDFMVPPTAIGMGRVFPDMAVSSHPGGNAQLFWLEHDGDGNPATMHVAGGTGDPDFVPVRQLTMGGMHEMDAAGSHVVIRGNGGEQQYYAAPPLADSIDAGVCMSARGCQPIRVGASQTSATDLTVQAEGAPTVVSDPTDGTEAVGVFPVQVAGEGRLAAQRLIPGCGELGDPLCTMPSVIRGTEGARGQHDTVMANEGEIVVVFHADDVDVTGGIFLVRFAPPPSDGAEVMPTQRIRLFNDGLVDSFVSVRAMEVRVQQVGNMLEIATLILGEGNPEPGVGLYLDILRVCLP